MLGIDIKKITKEITDEVLTAYRINDILRLLESIDHRLEEIEKTVKKKKI